MPDNSAAEKARRFLEIAGQFRLGNLTTEQSHPKTRDLSETTKRDTAAGLQCLFDVDQDVLETYRNWAQSDSPNRISHDVIKNLLRGGKIMFTGCGATGRLSIQLAALWRDFWQRAATPETVAATTAADWEARAFSVMAGGDAALIKSVEGFEDFTQFGRQQISDVGVGKGDTVFAITEGGETSFVIGTAWEALEKQAKVYFVYNNPDEILCRDVERSREILSEPAIEKINLTTGPMAITGSTRMQATSIQLCVMTTLLEMILEQVCAELTGSPAAPQALAAIPQRFLHGLEQVHQTLRDRPLREQLGRLVQREEGIHRQKLRNHYFANTLAIDVLTDTTERSPTFSLPPFKKFDDPTAAESTSFLFLPYPDSASAWKGLLKREIQPVEWDRETLRRRIGDHDLDRQESIVKTISRNEILRYRIGIDGLALRPTRPGDGATAILTENEIDAILGPDDFYRKQLESAHAAGGQASLIFFGTPDSVTRLRQFLQEWSVPVLPVLVPIPQFVGRLHALHHIAAKMLLNALSTATMVRLGRVMGNVMIRVVPSNLKLIDRSIRYIQLCSELDYEHACHLLHEAIEYVAPRKESGQEHPSPVGLAMLVAREGCSFQEAETKLSS